MEFFDFGHVNKVNFSTNPYKKVSKEYMQEIWNTVSEGIEGIQHQHSSPYSFEQMHRAAYNMVVYEYGVDLYTGVRILIIKHLVENVRPRLKHHLNNNFVKELNAEWLHHAVAMCLIRDILHYVDSHFVKKHNVLNIYDMGVKCFREKVVRHPELKSMLQKTLLEIVADERSGECIDQITLKGACEMLVSLGIDNLNFYEELFEKEFLEQSADFYRCDAQLLLKQTCIAVFAKHVEERIAEERSRCDRYLHSRTKARLIQVIETECITNHLPRVMEMLKTSIVSMIEGMKVEELGRVYGFFLNHERSGIDQIAVTMSAYLRDKILLCMNDEQKDPLRFVEALVELQEAYKIIVQTAFCCDSSIKKEVYREFEDILNKNTHIPEYLSNFIDRQLKKCGEKLFEDDDEELMQKVITLLSLVHNKDAFEGFYRVHLAKRLINSSRNTHIENEKSALSLLKAECGQQYTSRLENMINDIVLSMTHMASFKGFLKAEQIVARTDVVVSVLKAGAWPVTNLRNECYVPLPIRITLDAYRRFYNSMYTGRLLTFQSQYGIAIIDACYYDAPKTSKDRGGDARIAAPNARQYMLEVQTYQMLVLMTFNNTSMQKYGEIAAKTHILEKHLVNVLKSLSTGIKPEQCLLHWKKMPNGRLSPVQNIVTFDDEFHINDNFFANRRKVKVRPANMKHDAPAENRKQVNGRVDEERKMLIEAAIIRIMKVRKTLNHTELITVLMSNLKSKFMPTTAVIKTCIDGLINREYMARSVDDRKIYLYLA